MDQEFQEDRGNIQSPLNPSWSSLAKPPQHHPQLSHLYQGESIKTSIFSAFQMQMLWGAVDMCRPVTQQALRQCNFLSSTSVFHSVFFQCDYTLHIGVFLTPVHYSMQQLDFIDEGVCLQVVAAAMIFKDFPSGPMQISFVYLPYPRQGQPIPLSGRKRGFCKAG